MSSLFFFSLLFAHFFPCFVALWFSSFFHLSLSLSCAHHHHHRLFFFSISLPFQTLSLSLSFSLGNQSPLAFHSSPRLYVQVLQRRSLQAVRPFLDPARDVLVSVEQTRHRLLALSALCPGASTLLSNLLRRAAVPPPPPLPGQLQQQKGGGGGGGGQGGGGQRRLKGNSGGGSSLDAAAAAASQQQQRRTAGGRRWLRSYMNGCGNKIHVVRLTSPSLANVPFADAAAAMHAATGVLMIGVMRGGRSSSSSSSPSSSSSSFSSSSSSPAAVAGTVLNPGRRLLRGGDSAVVVCATALGGRGTGFGLELRLYALATSTPPPAKVRQGSSIAALGGPCTPRSVGPYRVAAARLRRARACPYPAGPAQPRTAPRLRPWLAELGAEGGAFPDVLAAKGPASTSRLASVL